MSSLRPEPWRSVRAGLICTAAAFILTFMVGEAVAGAYYPGDPQGLAASLPLLPIAPGWLLAVHFFPAMDNPVAFLLEISAATGINVAVYSAIVFILRRWLASFRRPKRHDRPQVL